MRLTDQRLTLARALSVDTPAEPEVSALVDEVRAWRVADAALRGQPEEQVARDRHGQGLPCAFCDGRTANVRHADDEKRHVVIHGMAVCRRCQRVLTKITGLPPAE